MNKNSSLLSEELGPVEISESLPNLRDSDLLLPLPNSSSHLSVVSQTGLAV